MRVLLEKRLGRAHRRADGGFSLLELLVALTVLMIGVSGILAMQMTTMRATSYSRHATEATILAEDKMEELRTEPVMGGQQTVDAQGNEDPDGLFERRWTVQPTAGGLLWLTVQVRWFERGGTEPHAIVLETWRHP